tara:strand:+ start:282 stop:686 length:405 start_codon:yes stop_codon:yes gene_type:complete
MSTLRTNALEGVDAKNSITIVAGAGNITTTNVQDSLTKSWINLDGSGTVAILESLNVGSITDQGTGQYLTTFSNNFQTADYCYSGGMPMGTTKGTLRAQDNADSTTSAFTADIFADGSNSDQDHYCVVFHGSLA